MKGKQLSESMWENVNAIEAYLCERISKLPHKTLLTDDRNKSTIWGYEFWDMQVYESHVKGICVGDDGHIWVLMDNFQIQYDMQSLLDADESEFIRWHSLKCGDILTIQTAYYIAEVIDEYLED